jgi:hypothetical protein
MGDCEAMREVMERGGSDMDRLRRLRSRKLGQ